MCRSKGYVYASLLGIVVLFWFLATLQFWSMEEDAFISFRYAESFAHGNGMYFNGDYGYPEWVAGFSNFLWVIILSVIVKIGLSIVAGSRILLLIIGTINIFLLYYLTRRITKQDRPLNLLPSILLVGNINYQWYATGGLEASLFICLAIGTLLFLIHEEEHRFSFPFSALFFLLLVMTRPEAPLYFLAALVWRVLKRRREHKIFKEDAVWLFTFLILYMAFLLFCLVLFRDPFPTSFSSKGFGRTNKLLGGVNYLFSFFMDSRGYLLFLPLVGLLFKNKWDHFASTKWLIVFFMIAGIVFVLASGGDGKTHYRFIVTFLPFSFIILTCGIIHFLNWFHQKIFALFFSLGTSLTVIFANSFLFKDFAPQGNILLADLVELGKNNSFWLQKWNQSFDYSSNHPSAKVGLWMNAHLDSSSYLATGQAGQIPYYARLRTLDLGGLNDYVLRNIRREYNWGFNTYILARRPDYIGDYDTLMYHYGESSSPTRLVDDPEFIANYELFKLFESDLKVAGEYIYSMQYVLFKRQAIPTIKKGWSIEKAVDEYVENGGEIIHFDLDYVKQ